MKTYTGETGVYEEEYREIMEVSSVEKAAVYERFFYTRHLLRKKYHEFILKLDNKEMLKKLSALLKSQNFSEGEFGKLLKRIEKWNNLEAPVPLQYIEFIGLKPISVETAARADLKAFREALNATFYPDSFFVNVNSGVLRVSLPDRTTEKEAIEIATNYETSEPVKTRYICIRDLKTIVIESKEKQYILTYPPILTFRKNLFVPGQVDNNNGKALC
ncbi:MAG: hypothetical protein EA361_13485 [Bacteroidetes bacterium]|nr:MAG: hypothetical protein EA361_13485 [Bacteroidota bacterium]